MAKATAQSPGAIVALLLAAGWGRRFDREGIRSKLLQPAPGGTHPGEPVAVVAARNLLQVLPRVLAIVRAADSDDQRRLHRELAAAGCTLVVNEDAAAGMGSSLASGVRASQDSAGWLVALADMPAIAPATIAAIVQALRDGAVSAAPVVDGRRGHPVGFAARCGPELMQLRGDEGARAVLKRHPPRLVAVDDPGCLLDLDRPEDFSRLR